jgi:hypothetical protein
LLLSLLLSFPPPTTFLDRRDDRATGAEAGRGDVRMRKT